VFINADAIEVDKKLAFWIQHCLAFVQTLPPKKPKAAKTAQMTKATKVTHVTKATKATKAPSKVKK
jgi:hypothetical protein